MVSHRQDQKETEQRTNIIMKKFMTKMMMNLLTQEKREQIDTYMSESDLQSLEMLEPESSSHDDSLNSVEQLNAAVSLSVPSVGLSAVREQANVNWLSLVHQ